MKTVAGRLRLDLAQYNELAAFAQFGADLDKASQAQLARGERLVELLKQDQYQPMPFERQVIAIFAGINGHLDDIPAARVREFETGLLAQVSARHPDIIAQLVQSRALDDALAARLTRAVAEFKSSFQEEKNP
jgi:F-type H+-transporting ATPase subunit alpha